MHPRIHGHIKLVRNFIFLKVHIICGRSVVTAIQVPADGCAATGDLVGWGRIKDQVNGLFRADDLYPIFKFEHPTVLCNGVILLGGRNERLTSYSLP